MSKKKWEKSNNRKQTGRFFAIPHSVLASANYIKLSAYALKLLVELGYQFNGINNGDLCATWSMMKNRGWKSRRTLNKALNELLHYEFIVKTRQGGRHAPSLYAVTWMNIDECKGKLDVICTKEPIGRWRIDKPDFIK